MISVKKAFTLPITDLSHKFRVENNNLDIGVSAFHLNKPKQTYTSDPLQYLPARKVVHANFESYLNERTVLNTNAIYQSQSGTQYFSIGAAMGYYLNKG